MEHSNTIILLRLLETAIHSSDEYKNSSEIGIEGLKDILNLCNTPEHIPYITALINHAYAADRYETRCNIITSGINVILNEIC